MDVKTLQAVIEKQKERVDYCSEMIDWCLQSDNHQNEASIWMHCRIEAKEAMFSVERMLSAAELIDLQGVSGT